MQIFVVVWDNIHISLWLPPSCKQLVANTACLHGGYWLYEPQWPLCCNEPASQLLLAPTLQLQHASARVTGSAALFGGSLRGTGAFYCFTSLVQLRQRNSIIETLTWNVWCETSLEISCSWVVIVAISEPRKGNSEMWSNMITFPLRGAVTSLSRCSAVKVFHSQQNGAWWLLWEKLFHVSRGMFAWEVIRNQHRSEVIQRLSAWLAVPADQLSDNAAGNDRGWQLGVSLIKGNFS